MKSIVVIIGVLLSHLISAQEWPVAVINDADGYVFVRSGPGKEYSVTDTIAENTFFYCGGDTNKFWIYIQNPVDGKMGYMHRSRIAFFYQLDSARQHKLILQAFQKTKRINEFYWTKLKQSTKEQATLLRKEHEDNFEGEYIPAFTAFKIMFCEHPDSILIVAFFQTLQPLRGSANEAKDWATAECWLCNPKFVENIICRWKNEEERQTIISSIETGMAMSNYEAQFTPAQLKKMYAKLEMKCN